MQHPLTKFPIRESYRCESGLEAAVRKVLKLSVF